MDLEKGWVSVGWREVAWFFKWEWKYKGSLGRK